jgi:outer membrane protein OmpA-like peptidoglycan-associated protein
MTNHHFKSATRYAVLILVMLYTGMTGIAQAQVYMPGDSAYAVFEGTILDASTKQPITALLTYESLPYGSTIGVVRGSNVTFGIQSRMDYTISVSADGYSNHISTVKVSEVKDGKLPKTIYLVPEEIKDIIRLEQLIFEQGKANITPESYEELDRLAEMLHMNPSMVIQLEGHTDFRGNEKQNLKLSESRVKEVKQYLVTKGISGKRIKTMAYGGSKPLTQASDPESRSKNRRVEVRILAN